jgi:hypothetical protein
MNDALSEAAANIVENIASRIARRQGGVVTPNHLAPYLPMSLDMIRECLEEMADEVAVTSETREGIATIRFPAYEDSTPESGPLEPDSCVGCGREPAAPAGQGVLCPDCRDVLHSDLSRLAERTGWPAHAVWEHEVLFLADGEGSPVSAEALAARSRYTLRRMQRKLRRLVTSRYARQELDADRGLLRYHFPEIHYGKPSFADNMRVIRSHPAAVAEEAQTKIVKIFFALGLMFLAMLVLAFCGFPFPLLLLLFFVCAPVTGWLIWRRHLPPDET